MNRTTAHHALGDYRYDRFRTADMLADLRFSARSVKPGERLVPVTLPMTDGAVATIGGEHDQPTVLITGSLTCPMTESSTPSVKRLHDEYGDRVRFVMVSGREAHPGERLPQPRAEGEARRRAEDLTHLHQLPFPVAIDTLDGALHQQLDLKPNTLVLIDRDGTVVFRSMWAGDHRDVRSAIDAVAAGRSPVRRESRAMVGPMSGALPKIMDVTRRGGTSAWADVRRSAPPMAMMAWLAARLPLPGDRARGVVAMIAPVLVMALLVAVVVAFV